MNPKVCYEARGDVVIRNLNHLVGLLARSEADWRSLRHAEQQVKLLSVDALRGLCLGCWMASGVHARCSAWLAVLQRWRMAMRWMDRRKKAVASLSLERAQSAPWPELERIAGIGCAR